MKQRGSVLVYAVIGLAVLAALWAVYSGIDSRGFDRGVSETKATYETRDANALREAQSRIATLEANAREAERRAAADIAAISSNYQRKLADANALRDRDVADARSGAIRLSFNSTGSSNCGPDRDSGQSGPGQAAAGAAGRDGGAQTELPGEIAANLLTLANDADAVVNQLSACQAVVARDRQ